MLERSSTNASSLLFVTRTTFIVSDGTNQVNNSQGVQFLRLLADCCGAKNPQIRYVSLAWLLLSQAADRVQKKGESMNISKIIPASVVILALAVTAFPVMAKQGGNAKGKNEKKSATKENSGRQAGELPSGLQKHVERKGQLPSGLQKKQDEAGQLTKGLQNGGKKLESGANKNKPSK